MPLGKITVDYKKIYDQADQALKSKDKLDKAKILLAGCLPAFQYFGRVPGAVYKKNTGGAGADFLISCDKDLMSVIPPNAKFKAFNARGDLGFVLMNSATKELTIFDSLNDASNQAVHRGLTYENVGGHQGRDVYARLDGAAVKNLSSGKHLTDGNIKAYESAMAKGVIPSGSTGSDGIKFDNSTWVIKLTISIAQAQQIDNSLSPMADEVRDDTTNRIYLNFNQLVMRH